MRSPSARVAPESGGGPANVCDVFEPPRESPRSGDADRPGVPAISEPAAATEGDGAPAPAKQDWKKGAGGAVAFFALLAAKLKGLLFVIFALKGYLLSGLSLIAAIWFYSLAFGLKFAVAFVLLLAIHELGHVFFIRYAGIPGGIPYFLPGLGAFTTMKQAPASAYQSSWIAFGGVLFGGMGAGICLSYGLLTGEPFWLAIANTGFLLNLLNMIPLPPFDGGRIVEAVSPKIWAVGLVLFVVGIVAFRLYLNPLIVIVVVLFLPRVFRAFRGNLDPGYYRLTVRQRSTVAVAYFALAALLAAGILASAVHVPGQTTFA